MCSEVAVASEDVAPAPALTESQAWLHTLVESEDWPGLRTESLRLAFDSPLNAGVWGFYTGWAELKLGHERKAVYRFIDLADHGPTPVRAVSGLAAALAWRGLDPELAERRYATLRGHADPNIARAATLGLAWTAADGARFGAVNDLLPELDTTVEGLLTRPRWRRAGVAGLLSAVIPGAGQTYAGAPQEGAAAFFVVGGLVAGTALLARDPDRRPGAIILGVITGSFYLGNIYGAIDAAVRRNRSRRRTVRRAIEDLERPVWPELAPTSEAAPR